MNPNESLVDKETPFRIAYFMEAGEQLVPDHPQVPSKAVQDMRATLIEEEFTELWEAYRDEDVPGIVDAGIDLAVVALGAALDAAPPQAVLLCLKAVLQANEAKVDPETGKLTLREDGKIGKPSGWVAPDIGAILRLYASDASFEEHRAGMEEVSKGVNGDRLP